MKINPQCQTECEINTQGSPSKEAQNKLKPEQKEKAMKEPTTMLDMGFKQSMCGRQIRLNQQTIRDSYPLPVIDDVLH